MTSLYHKFVSAIFVKLLFQGANFAYHSPANTKLHCYRKLMPSQCFNKILC